MYAGTLGSACRGSVPPEWRRGRWCPHTARMAEWVVGRLGAQRVDFGWPSVCLGESSSYTRMAEPAKHIGTRTIGIENDSSRPTATCCVPSCETAHGSLSKAPGTRVTRIAGSANTKNVRCCALEVTATIAVITRAAATVARCPSGETYHARTKMLRCGYNRRRSESTAGGRGERSESEARMRR